MSLTTENTGKYLSSRLIESFSKYSTNIALEIGNKKYTYNEVFNHSCKILSVLEEQSGEFIGVLAHRSLTAYSAILAISLSAKAWVPLNMKFPADRSLEMIRRSGIKYLIVGTECLDYFFLLLNDIPDNISLIFDGVDKEYVKEKLIGPHTYYFTDDLFHRESVDTLYSPYEYAYMLFTSGSTGKPKAVAVSQENVCAYLDNMNSLFRFSHKDRFSQTFDLTFDLSVHDILLCWVNGASLCVPVSDTPFAWKKYMLEKQISVWFSVPSVAVMMSKLRLLKPNSLPGLRYSFLCGEAFYESTAEVWKTAAPQSVLVNLYGPTEATIAISYYIFKGKNLHSSHNGIVSIGEIFPNQGYMIIDENGNESNEGELLLAGSQVVNGYFDDRELSKLAFVKIDELNFYITGDLVKRHRKVLYYLGRKDSEVKISGYRVNLQEIDHVLASFVGRDSVVTIASKDSEESILKIYVFISDAQLQYRESDLLEKCKQKLPWYMIPEKIITLDHYPYNANGKIDRGRLIDQYIR